MSNHIVTFGLLSAALAFPVASWWSGESEESSKLRCPTQHLAYSLCKQSYQELSTCADAKYDLDVCVQTSSSSSSSS